MTAPTLCSSWASLLCTQKCTLPSTLRGREQPSSGSRRSTCFKLSTSKPASALSCEVCKNRRISHRLWFRGHCSVKLLLPCSRSDLLSHHSICAGSWHCLHITFLPVVAKELSLLLTSAIVSLSRFCAAIVMTAPVDPCLCRLESRDEHVALCYITFPDLKLCCRWTAAEAEEYWSFAKETALERSNDRWTMDLSWLTDHFFTIPDHLQELCCQSQAGEVVG